jgi:hypothetical protein
MLDAEFGELVARRLAAIMQSAFDDIIAKLDTVLAGIEEIRGKLLLIERHYKTCPSVQTQDKGTQ